jgi:hypothetical protein
MDNRDGYEPDEIPEITPEMIEAGVLKLYSYDPDFGNEEDVVAAIFMSMLSVGQTAHKEAGRRVADVGHPA